MKLKRTATLAVLLLTIALGLKAQGVAFRNVSWDELKRLARTEQKAIFVDVYTSWCAPCRKMDREVFNQQAVGDYMNGRFVSVHVDAEKQKDFGLFRLFTPNAYPTFYWLDAEGNLLDVESGFMPVASFLERAGKALQNTIGVRYKALQKRWDAGERTPAFVSEFVLDVMPKIHVDSVRPYMNRYMAALSDSEQRTKEVGEMVTLFPRAVTGDAVWKAFVGHNDAYTALFGYDYWKKLYMNLVRVPMADRSDSIRQAASLACIDSFDFPDKQLFADLRDMERDIFAHRYAPALRKSIAIGKAHEDRLPYIYLEMFYTYIIGDFFTEAYQPSAAELADISLIGEKAFRLFPCQCSLMYLAAAQARGGDFRKAYATLANLPFYQPPVLSSAVYSLLNLSRMRQPG
ncbi:MAG: DUF255 domain-containing protein [Prevotella sp.]|nr:DUF255 domain-containing protein [Prevotella sp.]